MPNKILYKMSQNIFDYATSELSQDAFISLMISWFDSNDTILQKVSVNFITQLYNQYNITFHNNQLPPLKIKSIKIIQQHYKIDVFFKVTTECNLEIPFIIEDKTWTEPHSDQLQRYVNKIKEPSIKIFFKTGHLTEKDLHETKKAKYMIIDTKWIYDFLKPYKNQTSNLYLNDFFDYLKQNFYNELYTKQGKKKTLKEFEYKNIHKGFVQYTLIESIKSNIRSPKSDKKVFIKYTKNGKRWDTWWTFAKCNENDIKFFVKIKRIKANYRLRLIAYSTSKQLDKKEEIYQKLEINGKIKRTKKPEFKAKETEIAYLEVIDEDLTSYVQQFSIFLKVFKQQLKKLCSVEFY